MGFNILNKSDLESFNEKRKSAISSYWDGVNNDAEGVYGYVPSDEMKKASMSFPKRKKVAKRQKAVQQVAPVKAPVIQTRVETIEEEEDDVPMTSPEIDPIQLEPTYLSMEQLCELFRYNFPNLPKRNVLLEGMYADYSFKASIVSKTKDCILCVMPKGEFNFKIKSDSEEARTFECSVDGIPQGKVYFGDWVFNLQELGLDFILLSKL